MKIKKGQKMIVKHDRKGKMHVTASKDFDTAEVSDYPVVATERIDGFNSFWLPGESVPCRASLISNIELIK